MYKSTKLFCLLVTLLINFATQVKADETPTVTLQASSIGDSIGYVMDSVRQKLELNKGFANSTDTNWISYKQTKLPKYLNALIKDSRNGNANARVYVGWIADNGYGVKQNSTLALQLFKSVANKSAIAAYDAGVLTVTGRGNGMKDTVTALKYFQKATNFFMADAWIALLQYKAKNYDDALTAAKLAARHGDRVGYYIAAKIYADKNRYDDALSYAMRGANIEDMDSIILASWLDAQLAKNQNIDKSSEQDLLESAYQFKLIGTALANKSNTIPTSIQPPTELTEIEIDQTKSHAQTWLNTHIIKPEKYEITFSGIKLNGEPEN